MMGKEAFGHHISGQFNADMEAVKQNFLRMGALVERQIDDAIQALLAQDSGLALQVQAKDRQINAFENDIDGEVVRTLARRQPAASDLRLLMAIGKAVTDLERMGDEAFEVARCAVDLGKAGQVLPGHDEVSQLSGKVLAMARGALVAFDNLDAEAALDIMMADGAVTLAYRQAVQALTATMMQRLETVPAVLCVLWALRALKRIGDHARNVAEQLVYIVKGTDVRHITCDQIGDRLRLAARAG